MDNGIVSRRSLLAAGVAGAVGLMLPGDLSAAESGQPTAPVRTRSGQIRGLLTGGVRSYLGIPYAGSVAGQRRFRPAPPQERWRGVRDAFALGPMAPQQRLYRPVLADSHEVPYSEEHCLTVNVWTAAEPGQKRPVLVNIHGGGFTVGSGTLQNTGFSPDLVRDHNFVLVTFNHRLGALGFLPLAGIADEDYRMSGNVGTADQIMALRWVRDNIAAFGGDADQVTLVGQSAGGVAIGHLLSAPSAEGLFHRAVVEYGPIGDGNTPEQGAELARRFFDKLGLAPSEWKRLLDLPVEQLLEAQGNVGEMLGILYGDKLWVPVNDGHLLARNSLQALARSRRKIPLITGCDIDHMAAVGRILPKNALPTDSEGMVIGRLRRTLGPHTDSVLAHFRGKHPDATLVQLLITIQGELFRGGLIHMAEANDQAGAPAWMYLTMPGKPMDMPRERLVQFVLTGKPDLPGVPQWPNYTLVDRATLIVDAAERVERDPFGDDRAVLRDVVFGA